MNYILVSRDFSASPGPGKIIHGEFSGEKFLKTLLEEKYLKSKDEGVKLIVDLDGAIGYSSGFLNESFGELAKKYGAAEVQSTLELYCNDEPSLIREINKYICGK